jgi:glutathione S-transferase
MTAPYIVHGAPFSLFTRKLEAAFRFYDLPMRQETAGIGGDGAPGTRADTRQIPVLHTPENWMLGDTTPILDLLDGRVPARRLFPVGPIGVLVHIVEEVLDEWIARVMVHFRWHYAENTRHIVGQFVGRDVTLEEASEFPLAKWGPRACRATGTESEFHQQAAEKEYFALLAALESQLGGTAYALGDRPTAVDTILLGGLRAHTNADPLPDLSAYPRCLEWEQESADQWDGEGQLSAFPESTPFAAHVLALAKEEYAPFLLGNAHALATSQKAFSVDTHGETASYLARPYPETSRQMIKDRIRLRLTADERVQVEQWLEATGLTEAFAP